MQHVVPEGYSCAAGLSREGWFAGVVVLRDFDEEYLRELGRRVFEVKEGKTEPGWADAFVRQTRRLLLVAEGRGERAECVLSEAELIDGPPAASSGVE